MALKIVWDKKAFEELNKLEAAVGRRIAKKVDELAEDPFSCDVKKLRGVAGYRLRVGDYRVIFDIDNDTI